MKKSSTYLKMMRSSFRSIRNLNISLFLNKILWSDGVLGLDVKAMEEVRVSALRKLTVRCVIMISVFNVEDLGMDILNLVIVLKINNIRIGLKTIKMFQYALNVKQKLKK